jgi:hypothetical protein
MPNVSVSARKMAQSRTTPGDELRARIKRLGLTYARAAEQLGLTLDGLNKQMRGDRKVGRQTEVILGHLEYRAREQRNRRQVELPIERQKRRDRQLAQYLYPSAPHRPRQR